MIRCPRKLFYKPLSVGRYTDYIASRLEPRFVSNAQKRFYQAAVCTKLGKPMVMCEKESEPINSKQIRIKVHAAAVNFGDILTVGGTYQDKHDPPFIPGNEFSGVVTEVGSDVTRLKLGTRICGMRYGKAYAEEAIVKENDVFEIPDNMSHTVASGFMVSYGTASLALEEKAKIKKGNSVLVTAAAGAVGLAAVDLAKNVYDSDVFGAAGGQEKCEFLKTVGAHSIDYKKDDIRTAIRSIKPKGVDIVFESVGGDVFNDCFRSLAPDGRLIIVGFVSGKLPTIQANHTLVKNLSVMGLNSGIYKLTRPALFNGTVESMLKLYKKGKIKPRVDKTFKLTQVNEAFEYIRVRKNIGRVVIEM